MPAEAEAFHVAEAEAFHIAEVGGIVLTAVTMSISSAHLALQRSSMPPVQEIARMTLDENVALNMETLRLLGALSLEPVESGASTVLEGQAKEAIQTLAATGPEDFDRSYIAHEIAYRRRLLRFLDESLIPGSDHSVRELLLRVRSTLKTQLERADVLAASVGGR